jgi:hypothetical protein
MSAILTNHSNKLRKVKHPLFAFFLSLLVLACVLLLLWLGQLAKRAVQDKVVVREVALVALPPPPPLAVSQASPSKSLPSLVVQGAGVAIQAVDIKVNSSLDLISPTAPTVTMNMPKLQSMSVNVAAFNLDDLDEIPALLTRVKTTIPKKLSRELTSQGIEKFIIKLDIFINEAGRVNLLNIVKNPYVEMNPKIKEIVKNTRFSPPKKAGVAVRTRFIWPIEFTP